MSFVYARVDSRLIHGQVGAKLVRYLNVNRIVLVDDSIAKDAFMKQIYEYSAKACGAAVEIYSVEEAAQKYKAGRFDSKRNLLLFGSIDTAYRTLQAGIDFPELAVGSIKCDNPNMKLAYKLVYIYEEDAVKLREIQDKGVKVYFQLMPGDDKPVSIEDGIKMAGF